MWLSSLKKSLSALRNLWITPKLEISLLVLYLVWICFLNLFSFFSSTLWKNRFILANFSFLLPHYFVSSTFSIFDYAPFLFLVVFNIKTQLSIHCVSSLFMSLQSHYCCSKKSVFTRTYKAIIIIFPFLSFFLNILELYLLLWSFYPSPILTSLLRPHRRSFYKI